jgi:hypothetical protein
MLTASIPAPMRPTEIGSHRPQPGSYVSDKDDGALPPLPAGDGRTPFGVGFMLAIFLVGLFALTLLGNMDWFV